MPDLSITFDQAKVAALFGRLDGASATGTLVPPITRGVARLRADLAAYPPPSRKPQPPRTPAQRRLIFAKIRRGEIPYRRTGNLGRSWTDQVEVTATGVVGTVGNSVTSGVGRDAGGRFTAATHYGPLVQGKGTQSSYFQGSAWPTDQSVADKHKASILDDLARAIDDALGS